MDDFWKTALLGSLIFFTAFSSPTFASSRPNEDVSFRDRVWGYNSTAIWNYEKRSTLYINDSICLWNTSLSVWICAHGEWNGTINVTGTLSVNRTYFFNNTVATHDGNLGGYSGADSLCAAEFAGTHLCGLQELLDTVHDKALPAAWTGYAWYSTGGSKYLSGKPTDDCHGWTSDSATDYLGSFWVFGTGYTDAYGSTVNCGESKSLACCKAY